MNWTWRCGQNRKQWRTVRIAQDFKLQPRCSWGLSSLRR